VATPWKTHGIFTAFSADVLPIGPLVGLYAAVTRKGVSGKVWGADERVTIQDAIRAYTVNSAYINFDENIKGSLQPGMLADMVVMGDDLLTMPPDRIKDARVDMTIVGGKILYERQGVQIAPSASTRIVENAITSARGTVVVCGDNSNSVHVGPPQAVRDDGGFRSHRRARSIVSLTDLWPADVGIAHSVADQNVGGVLIHRRTATSSDGLNQR
jgi:hypothetical protein